MKRVLVLMSESSPQNFQPYPSQCLLNFRSSILQSKETISYFLRKAELGFDIARPQTAALQTYKVLNVRFIYTLQNITTVFAIPSLLLTENKAT